MEMTTRTPDDEDRAVLAALARFQQGMPEPGLVTIALIAATFRTSWIAAAGMIARAKQRQQGGQSHG